MKSFLFATLAFATLLTSISVFAAPTPGHDHDRDGRYQQGPVRRDDHFDRDHRVTVQERRRWEMGHNYGYAQNYRVSREERAHWEAQYRRR